MRNDQGRLADDNEIDLIELVEGVWRQKLWVAVIAVPIVLVGLAYALLAPRVYQARLFVEPPSRDEIAQLNYGRGGDSGLSTYSVKDVYDVYVRELNSETVRSKFYRTVYEPALTGNERVGSRDVLYAQFLSKLTVEQVTKDGPNRYVIAASTEDPNQAAQWVAAYAEMASELAKEEVLTGHRSELAVKAENLQWEIDAAQASARKLREDQLVRLREALKVAKSIGLEKPPIISGSLSSEVSAAMSGALTYMRGSKAIEAEIETLQSRSSDDAFIDGLRARQERLAFYRGLKVDPQSVQVFTQDGVVELPDKPVKPKRALIVTAALVLGLAVGVLVAIMRDLLLRRRKPAALSRVVGNE